MKNYIKEALKTELKDYQEVQKRNTPQICRLMHASSGMCTEAGEFLDMLKKHIFYGKDFDRTNAIEELGDMLWYIAIACDELGVTLEKVQEININKLKVRYPNKFTQVDAITRDLEKEEEALNS